ncbi:MAG: dihydroorotate dehydrogenase electron transfer subunit [Desulfomonilia bacterium]
MNDIGCLILRNDEVAEKTYLMVLEGCLDAVRPGQFLMVQVNTSLEPFLRRPLAVLSSREQCIEILFKVRGKGTKILSEKRAGDSVSILGPLGKGFTEPDPGEQVLYVAGGAGLPPILSMAEHICRGIFIYGAKTGVEIPVKNRLLSLRAEQTLITTEDGSVGEKGRATEMLSRIIKNIPSLTRIYACGPNDMLHETWKIAIQTGTRCEVSLEEHMACGFGVCTGCIVETRHGNQRVCKEGPVFDAGDIFWR